MTKLTPTEYASIPAGALYLADCGDKTWPYSIWRRADGGPGEYEVIRADGLELPNALSTAPWARDTLFYVGITDAQVQGSLMMAQMLGAEGFQDYLRKLVKGVD